jgi:hypothetical protein
MNHGLSHTQEAKGYTPTMLSFLTHKEGKDYTSAHSNMNSTSDSKPSKLTSLFSSDKKQTSYGTYEKFDDASSTTSKRY